MAAVLIRNKELRKMPTQETNIVLMIITQLGQPCIKTFYWNV